MLNTETFIKSNNITLEDYRRYIVQVMSIQAEAVRRLAESDETPPIEMAAVLEDVANTFLDISDEIRDYALGRKTSVKQVRLALPEEVDSL